MKQVLSILMASVISFAGYAQLPSLVADVNKNGSSGSNPDTVISWGGNIYFFAEDSTNRRQLWRYDGSSAPSIIQIPGAISVGNGGALLNNQLYFQAQTAAAGKELFRYDGVNAPALAFDLDSTAADSEPMHFREMGGQLYFTAKTASQYQQYQLFRYDGITKPVLIPSLISQNANNYIAQLEPYNGLLYFTIVSGYGYLMAYNPASGICKSIVSGFFGRFNIANNRIYLSDYTGLYSTNLAGTDTLKAHTRNYFPNGDLAVMAHDLKAVYSGNLIFGGFQSIFDPGLYRYNFAEDSVHLITPLAYVKGISNYTAATDMCVYDGQVFLGAALDSNKGFELYKYDGNTLSLVADINPGKAGSMPGNFKLMNGYLYFAADDSVHGRELFRLRSATGIEKVSWKGSVRVYPNPTNAQATLELQIERTESLDLALFDAAGRQV